MANVRIKDLSTTASTTASDDFFGVDGATNGTRKLNAYSPTFGGNLTVSGTGTSSVAGNLVVGAGTSISGVFSRSIAIGNTSYPAYSLSSTAAGGRYLSFGQDIFGSVGSWVWHDETGAAYRMVLKGDSGNLLLGTTTDGGQKLQVAGNLYVGSASGTSQFGTSGNSFIQITGGGDTISGYYSTTNDLRFSIGPSIGGGGKAGIAFGSGAANADTSLYREAAGTLSINHSGGDSRLYFYNAGTAQGRVESASSNFFVTAMAGSLILRSGGATTALTLDSSQRCILAGALRLNNAYTAGAPTATGYVTIEDSAGNSYKVLVGT